MSSKIYLSKPHLSGFEEAHMLESLSSNWVSTVGENINQFEFEIEKYLGKNKFVSVLNSGTSSIHLALVLAGVKKEDYVICQSFTFSASANPIVYLGANPIFIDSELETWNMCPELLEKAINDKILIGKKPRAIIIVYAYGMPAKIKEIVAIAKKYSIFLIEDSAEALGSEYNGQKCGTFGDFGVLSFNGNKIITTSSGGALICNTKKLKKKAVFLAMQARDNYSYYQHSETGYNYRMSNVLAGIGRGQIKVLDEYVRLRREVNQFYQTIFKDVKGVEVLQEPTLDFYSNHWLSCIIIDSTKSGFKAEELKQQFFKDDIESRSLWKPLHLQPVFNKYESYETNVSEYLFNNGLCLPSSSNLTISEKKRISRSINKIILKV